MGIKCILNVCAENNDRNNVFVKNIGKLILVYNEEIKCCTTVIEMAF